MSVSLMMTRAAGAALAAVAAAASLSLPGSAHVTVASQYTFNRDVLPIVRSRCAPCHAERGVAAMLTRYADAKKQAWPIRQALMSGRMPPWSAEGQPVPFKNPRTLTAREFNVLMTWSAGGTPEGKALPARAESAAPEWPLGAPQAVIAMPAPFTLAAGVDRADHETLLTADALRGQWIRAVDLSPGSPSIVQRAEVAIRAGGRDRTIALWTPGDTPAYLEDGAAFKVPDEAVLMLRMHYRRTSAPPSTVTDLSRVGVYLGSVSGSRAVRLIELTGDGEFPFGATRLFTKPVDGPARVVALRPVGGPIDALVRLTIVAPDGSRRPLATLQLRAGWPRRYVLASPVALLGGSRLEALVSPSNGMIWSTLTGDLPIGPADGGPLRLAFEVID